MKRLALFVATVVAVIVASAASLAFGASGLVINATEIGVGKFHRYDNHQHPYAPNNVWAPHITPDNAGATPIVFSSVNGSVTIQFSNLEEMLRTLVQVSTQKQMKVAILNINGHGMPGGMWYPKDAAQKASPECAQWNQAAAAPDVQNYNQYYGAVSKSEIMALRATANHPAHYSCVTSAPEWQEIVARIPNIQDYFTDDAQIHFESCLVGLGPVGEAFTKAVGAALLKGDKAMVKASTNFGLGDWSMPEGMGFWDYFTDEQLKHDNEVYPLHKQDREIMKKGILRVTNKVSGAWTSGLIADQDFMLVGLGFQNARGRVARNYHLEMVQSPLPTVVHIPGTMGYAKRMN